MPKIYSNEEVKQGTVAIRAGLLTSILLSLSFLVIACAGEEGENRLTTSAKLTDSVDTPTGLSKNTDVPRLRSLRIAFFTSDLFNASKYCAPGDDVNEVRRPNFHGFDFPCYSIDVLTHNKRRQLMLHIVSSAVRTHMNRLLVNRTRAVYNVGPFEDNSCKQFSVPPEHLTSGFGRSDYALYLAAGPYSLFALPCYFAANGRPIAGVMNFAPRHIDADRHTIRLAVHEIAHALGFHHKLLKKHGLVEVRDKIPYLTGKAVHTIENAKSYFKCDTLTEIPLEDEGNLEEYHFERRFAKEELMVAKMDGTAAYSSLTLGVFHDLGFYVPVYDKAEPMKWGANATCDFMSYNCPHYQENKYSRMFCERSNSLKQCSFDRLAVGHCHKGKFTNNCPIVDLEESSFCIDTTRREADNKRCVERKNASTGKLKNAMCVEMSCGRSKESLRVRMSPTDPFVLCPEGKTVNYTKDEVVVCPKYNEVCPLHFAGFAMSHNVHDRFKTRIPKKNVIKNAFYEGGWKKKKIKRVRMVRATFCEI